MKANSGRSRIVIGAGAAMVLAAQPPNQAGYTLDFTSKDAVTVCASSGTAIYSMPRQERMSSAGVEAVSPIDSEENHLPGEPPSQPINAPPGLHSCCCPCSRRWHWR